MTILIMIVRSIVMVIRSLVRYLKIVNLEEEYEVSLPSGGVVMLSTIDIEDAKRN